MILTIYQLNSIYKSNYAESFNYCIKNDNVEGIYYFYKKILRFKKLKAYDCLIKLYYSKYNDIFIELVNVDFIKTYYYLFSSKTWLDKIYTKYEKVFVTRFLTDDILIVHFMNILPELYYELCTKEPKKYLKYFDKINIKNNFKLVNLYIDNHKIDIKLLKFIMRNFEQSNILKIFKVYNFDQFLKLKNNEVQVLKLSLKYNFLMSYLIENNIYKIEDYYYLYFDN